MPRWRARSSSSVGVARAASRARQAGGSSPANAGRVQTFRQRLAAIERMDFFDSAGRDRVVALLDQVASRTSTAAQQPLSHEAARGELDRRDTALVLWVTRPRPGRRSHGIGVADSSLRRSRRRVWLRTRSRQGSKRCRALRHVRRRARTSRHELHVRNALRGVRHRRCSCRPCRVNRSRSQSEGWSLRCSGVSNDRRADGRAATGSRGRSRTARSRDDAVRIALSNLRANKPTPTSAPGGEAAITPQTPLAMTRAHARLVA